MKENTRICTCSIFLSTQILIQNSLPHLLRFFLVQNQAAWFKPFETRGVRLWPPCDLHSPSTTWTFQREPALWGTHRPAWFERLLVWLLISLIFANCSLTLLNCRHIAVYLEVDALSLLDPIRLFAFVGNPGRSDISPSWHFCLRKRMTMPKISPNH